VMPSDAPAILRRHEAADARLAAVEAAERTLELRVWGEAGLRVGGGGLAGIDLGVGFGVVVRRPRRSWRRTEGLEGGRGVVEDQRRWRLEEGGAARWILHRWPQAVRPAAEAGPPARKKNVRWRSEEEERKLVKGGRRRAESGLMGRPTKGVQRLLRSGPQSKLESTRWIVFPLVKTYFTTEKTSCKANLNQQDGSCFHWSRP
jgi:hypothetical protein